jgi:hypothetical protein
VYEGERARQLWAAVLIEVLAPTGSVPRDCRDAHENEQFLNADAGPWAEARTTICDVVGIDPNIFRKRATLARERLLAERPLRSCVKHPPLRSQPEAGSLQRRVLDALRARSESSAKGLAEALHEERPAVLGALRELTALGWARRAGQTGGNSWRTDEAEADGVRLFGLLRSAGPMKAPGISDHTGWPPWRVREALVAAKQSLVMLDGAWATPGRPGRPGQSGGSQLGPAGLLLESWTLGETLTLAELEKRTGLGEHRLRGAIQSLRSRGCVIRPAGPPRTFVRER